MTTELITGKAGTPHVSSDDIGVMQAGLIGYDTYLLKNNDGNYPAITLKDSNHATIPVMQLIVEGRYVRVTSAETATIESGVSGQKRNDLICLKYTRDSSNIETASIVVLKGTNTTGTPVDPTVPAGNILTGASSAFMPLYRVPLDGITVGTPVPLFNVLRPMSELWDSVTQAPVVQAGTISAKSDALAVIRLKYASPNGRPPDSLVVSLGPFDVEASAKQASVMVWTMSADNAQIRVRRNYDGAWWDSFQATISWIAVWNHV